MFYNHHANPIPADPITGTLSVRKDVDLRWARWHADKNAAAKGTVCLFQGRGECIEKHFETIDELRKKGFVVATLDWRGQGGSSRILKDASKGHIERFEDYLEDLSKFMQTIVLPDTPAPHYAMAHSMGGAILLMANRFLRTWFHRMVLLSPMLGIHSFQNTLFLRYLVRALILVKGTKALVPKPHLFEKNLTQFVGNLLTSDNNRFSRTMQLFEAQPQLFVTAPTLGWVNQACRMMLELSSEEVIDRSHIPTLILAGQGEKLVSLRAIEDITNSVRAINVLYIAGARHELLNERDIIRAQVWSAFDAFIPGSQFDK